MHVRKSCIHLSNKDYIFKKAGYLSYLKNNSHAVQHLLKHVVNLKNKKRLFVSTAMAAIPIKNPEGRRFGSHWLIENPIICDLCKILLAEPFVNCVSFVEKF